MANRIEVVDDEHLDEAWLVPYCDILTLLLALFIVLFAMSKIDLQKFEEVGASFEKLIHKEPIVKKTTASKNKSKISPLEELKIQVDNFIKANELESTVSTAYAGDGILITIRDDILFKSGSADFAEDKRNIAKSLGTFFEKSDDDKYMEVIISGHSDNVPINTPQFNSNWKLSAIRAVNFLEAIVTSNNHLDPGHFSARGFGEMKPLAPNDSEENKQKNRRVEIQVRPVLKSTEIIPAPLQNVLTH